MKSFFVVSSKDIIVNYYLFVHILKICSKLQVMYIEKIPAIKIERLRINLTHNSDKNCVF